MPYRVWVGHHQGQGVQPHDVQEVRPQVLLAMPPGFASQFVF